MKAKVWQRISRELHPFYLFKPDQIIPSLVSGLLIGLMTSILSISFAVLVFGTALPEALSLGIGMALLSNLILHLSSALTSSGEGVVSHSQSLPPPIQAAMMTSVMAMIPITTSVEGKTQIAVFTLMFSAIFTGATLFAFGRLKFGKLVRFLPFPVISGFLAAIGLALLIGGISTMTNKNVTIYGLSSFFSLDLIIKWLPGVLLAVALQLISSRWKSTMAFPVILGTSIFLFFSLTASFGVNISTLMTGGWLLGPFENVQLWHVPAYAQILTIDWHFLYNHLGIIATIPLVCFIGGLLMLSAIELTTGAETDANFELETMGISNFLSGILGGGFIGYPSTTFTVMQFDLGATTRLAGILSAIVTALVLILGAYLLGFIPRFVVGGLLIFFGYQFLHHWVIKAIKRSPLSDLYIIAAIIATSHWLGFVPSVILGVLAAVVFFLYKYSQTNVIRYVASGASHQSRTTRNALHNDWLQKNGERIVIFGLQGYIFFGSAHSFQEKVMSATADSNRKALDYVILDFRHVTGIDTSVLQGFQKLHAQLLRKNITLIFTELAPKHEAIMRKIGFLEITTAGIEQFDVFDEALEWCENQLLVTSDLPAYTSPSLTASLTGYIKDKKKTEIMMKYFNRIALSPGTKIIQQNMVAYDLFFVESGRLSAYLEREYAPPIRLQTIVDDTMVGEIGFYLNQLRTATVIADKPSVVYRLSTDALAKMEKNHPAVAIELHRYIVEKTAMRVNHVFKSLKKFL